MNDPIADVFDDINSRWQERSPKLDAGMAEIMECDLNEAAAAIDRFVRHTSHRDPRSVVAIAILIGYEFGVRAAARERYGETGIHLG